MNTNVDKLIKSYLLGAIESTKMIRDVLNDMIMATAEQDIDTMITLWKVKKEVLERLNNFQKSLDKLSK